MKPTTRSKIIGLRITEREETQIAEIVRRSIEYRTIQDFIRCGIQKQIMYETGQLNMREGRE